MDGVAFDRIVGFEDLGGKDEFPTILLTRKLVKTGCLKALNKLEYHSVALIYEENDKRQFCPTQHSRKDRVCKLCISKKTQHDLFKKRDRAHNICLRRV